MTVKLTFRGNYKYGKYIKAIILYIYVNIIFVISLFSFFLYCCSKMDFCIEALQQCRMVKKARNTHKLDRISSGVILNLWQCLSDPTRKMGDFSADSITVEMLREAHETVRCSPLDVIRTPMIPWCQTTLPLNISGQIHIKLENMQRTGGFMLQYYITECLIPIHLHALFII